ncbi:MAG TPA: cystathionine gamma-synthase [Sphingomicrobium sp.]|nr:cystathionine gamma-synthase [Sphingomicrobium sp.]
MTKALSTRAVRAGIDIDASFGAVVPPLVLSANFSFEAFDRKRRYDYSRSGNPTRDQLGDALASLEGGAGAVVTATGIAAIALVIHTLLKPGDRLLIPHDCYGGSWRLFTALAAKGAFDLDTCDLTDVVAMQAAIERKPTLVWVETPSNPLLRITDIAAVSALAKAVGALVVVDNTFLSPALQCPIEHGADIVIHSTTKYINGHSDVVGGAAIARDAALLEQLAWWGNALGVTASPFDCYMTLRGLRTLPARLAIQQQNCAAIAEFLLDTCEVRTVHYPALPDHPGNSIAARQQRGAGAMLSFELAGGEKSVKAFVEGLTCFTLAESLGAVESLVAHPATMTHAAMSEEARVRAGIAPGLLRLSVGLEHLDDLLADIEGGLGRVSACLKDVVDER